MATVTEDKPATSSPISTRKHGDVLIVVSNNPPVNSLGHAVRQGLVEGIREAEADDSVKAVVIVGEGQTFFAGADISEFGTPKAFAEPMLPQVVDIIENCSKPVVAAIHGTALGGGLEVALACHYRVALPSAKLGTPEVKLGLLPGAGGTQRLPRVAGVRKALEMCAGGNPISAKDAFDCGLVDRLIEDDLIPHAVGYAEEVRDVRPLPKSSERAVQDQRVRPDGVRGLPQGECPQVPRLRRSGSQHPRRRILLQEALRGRRHRRAQAVHGADERHAGEGAAIFLLRRAQGGEDREPSRRHPAAPDPEGRRDRRRHDGRRHFDELPVGGHSRHHLRDEPGSARPRVGRDAQELRSDGGEGPDDDRPGREGDGPADPDARLRRRWPIATSSSRRCSSKWT